MSIYTKGGDKGTTNLVHTKNVSKSDDRIQLEGTIDELSCHIGPDGLGIGCSCMPL